MSRGVGIGDLDGDGDLDLVLTALDAPALVLRNDRDEGAYLVVEPRLGSPPRADPGAVVRLETDAGGFVAPANPGRGYLAAGSAAAHFGLPPGVAIREVVVAWSDGTRERFEPPLPDRRVILVRGAGKRDGG